MIHLAKRVFRQTINDKRSVMMILVAPLLILTLVYFLLGDSDYVPTVGINKNAIPDSLVTALEEQDLNVIDINDAQQAKEYLKNHNDVDAIFTLS
ncbi:hypothetical protein [Metabacillus litoralis]|uniref:hypothetical protein n=1 Tax=Metabacillus litoralis TaxID=152268 RepID=UPI001CFE2C84|nr:hypothetical protein [Metabacillus litoralis]